MRSFAWFCFIVFPFSFVLAGCIIEVDGDSSFDVIRGQGRVVQETRVFSDITGVAFALEGELVILEGLDDALVIEAQANLLEFIETNIRNGVLYIETDDDYDLQPSVPMRFVLSAEVLREISILGSGDIQVDSWDEDALFLSVAGSGDLFIRELTVDRLESSIAGSGDMDLAGTAPLQEVSLAGSGDYEARALSSVSTEISIAGSGDAFVQVSDELDVSIAGSGSVFYLGNPSVNSSILGSGSVRALDR